MLLPRGSANNNIKHNAAKVTSEAITFPEEYNFSFENGLELHFWKHRKKEAIEKGIFLRERMNKIFYQTAILGDGNQRARRI